VSEMSAWSAKQATTEIREIAQSRHLTVSYSKHSLERFVERGLIMSDILYVVKFGFVYMEPIPSTRSGWFKYAIESKCPNGGSRSVRVVVVPDKKTCSIKIVSVMWVDENETRAGSIIGEENE
jgi:Domain of unknown function (DUF4258)